MKLIYIDESGTFNDGLTLVEAKTNKRKSLYFVLSALIVDLDDWEKVFGRFKKLRSDVRHNYNIKKSEQLHAYELAGGTGVWKHRRYKHLTSPKRQRLLKYLLTNYATWPELSVITVVVSKLTLYPSIQPNTARQVAYENLFNRIDKTFAGSAEEGNGQQYIVVNDGQEDAEIIKHLRKMRAYNSVRMSNGDTVDTRIKGLVEDPFFKTSKHSYFLQCIDHIAYSTLHLFDDRLNPSIGKDLLLSGLYDGLGIKAVHYPTADILSGVVIAPKMTRTDIDALRRKSLGT